MINYWTKRTCSQKGLHMNTNIAWGLVGKIIYAVSRGGLLIMIAKLGNAIMVGQFALAFAITTPVFMLADLNLRSVYATDVTNRFDFRHYLGLRVSTSSVALVVIAVIAFSQEEQTLGMIIMLVGLARGFESMSDMAFGLYQRQQRLDRVGRSLISKGVLTVILMGLLLWQSHNLTLSVMGLTVAWLAVFIIFDYKNIKKYTKKCFSFNIKYLIKLFRLSLPLGIVLLIISLNNNIIKYMIKGIISVEALGYYASIIYLMIVGSTLVSTLGQATNTKLATLYKNSDIRGFVKIVMKLVGIVALVGIIAVLLSVIAGEHILTILYDASYGAYKDVMVLIMIGAAFMYLSNMLNYAVTAIQKFKIQPILYGAILVIGAVVNFSLISRWGLYGAATGLIFIYLMQFIANASVLILVLYKGSRKSTMTHDNFDNVSLTAVQSIHNLDNVTINEWQKLLSDNGCDIVFCNPEFIRTWANVYKEDYKLLILVAKRQEEIIGICPLCYQKGILGYTVYYAGHPHTTHMDIITKIGFEQAVVSSMISYLYNTFHHFSIHLFGFLETSKSLQAIYTHLQSQSIPHATFEVDLPTINIKNQNFDVYYHQTFSGRTRKKNRQKFNRLKLLGDISFRQLKAHEMEDVYTLHQKRWLKKCDTSGFISPKGKAFFTDLIKNNLANVYGLFVDDHLVSFKYIFLCQKRCMLYRSSHDELLSMYKIGMHANKYMIRHCCETGQHIVDFGIGYEPYKMQWKPQVKYAKCVLFSGASFLSHIVFIIRKHLINVKYYMKKYRWAVIFKRNTLGKVKYLFSIECIATLVNKFKHRLKIYGRKLATNEWGKHCYICLTKEQGHDERVISSYVDLAKLTDVEKLSNLMLCDVKSIIKRFYIRHQCYAMKKDNSIRCCAWVHQHDLSHHTSNVMDKLKQGYAIYDIFYRKDIQSDELKELINHICYTLAQDGWKKIYLRIDERDNKLIRAAKVTEFKTELYESYEDMIAQERGL